jgi:hypothetical protein
MWVSARNDVQMADYLDTLKAGAQVISMGTASAER